MRYLTDGSAGQISKIGLGTWQFGSPEWGYGESYAAKEASVIVRRATELGITLFDTAEIYSAGRSEEILGSALGDARNSVLLATKVFPLVPSAAAVKWRARASARRLGTARIGLYQVHYPNPLVGDRTLMRAMRDLRRSGLVAEVGVSAYPLARWRAAEAALGGRVLSNQVEYSLVRRGPELDLLPYAEQNDRILIAHSPLAMGLLSGRYHQEEPAAAKASSPGAARASSPLFQPAYLARTRHLIETLREIADAHSATPAQIALAWAIHHPAVVAIPGASSVRQLEQNVAAADIVLAADEYRALCVASADLSEPEAAPSFLGAVRHCARCGRYVAGTVLRDRQLRGPAPSALPTMQAELPLSRGHRLAGRCRPAALGAAADRTGELPHAVVGAADEPLGRPEARCRRSAREVQAGHARLARPVDHRIALELSDLAT
jgi:aryl-alcohol dehydrogenase-like predicted oxidoreductase